MGKEGLQIPPPSQLNESRVAELTEPPFWMWTHGWTTESEEIFVGRLTGWRSSVHFFFFGLLSFPDRAREASRLEMSGKWTQIRRVLTLVASRAHVQGTRKQKEAHQKNTKSKWEKSLCLFFVYQKVIHCYVFFVVLSFGVRTGFWFKFMCWRFVNQWHRSRVCFGLSSLFRNEHLSRPVIWRSNFANNPMSGKCASERSKTPKHFELCFHRKSQQRERRESRKKSTLGSASIIWPANSRNLRTSSKFASEHEKIPEALRETFRPKRKLLKSNVWQNQLASRSCTEIRQRVFFLRKRAKLVKR